jgi:phosphoribosyl-ATP pyrophosphohydrolase/phosphoribosyl-AMP cyclohydrolase
MLRIAVQKSGRLQEESLLILKECGLKVDSLLSEESADLLFHYLLLLKAQGYALNNVLSILYRRMK